MEAVVGGIAEAPPFRNADANSVVSLPQIDVRKGMPPVKLSREEFEKRYSSRFADRVFKPLQRELGAIVDVGATWTGDHDRKRAPAWCQKEYEQKALELSGGTADPSRNNSAFFPIGHNPSAA